MSAFEISIDGKQVPAERGQTVLQVARKIGLDIPTLCHLEKCGPLTSCQVCLVKVVSAGQGRLVPSCATKVEPGMVIESESEEVHEARRTALELLFSDHVGDCLSPCNRLCPLQLNIPLMLRQIKAEQFDDANATLRQALPLAAILGRLCHHPCEQGCRRGVFDQPAAIREMERFLTDRQIRSRVARCAPRINKSALVIGAGPTGLTAAHDLARRGYQVTVMDRNADPGGKLRGIEENQMPAGILQREVTLLGEMGIDFMLGAEVGNQEALIDLQSRFDAVLVSIGELTGDDGQKLGLPLRGAFIKADPSTCLASAPGIFAAGACVKPVKQLVRAMAEGRSAGECVHRYLSGQSPRRPEKPFSSAMGRLEPGELRDFLRSASSKTSIMPCARCSGLEKSEVIQEAARCLHCDCQSSGNCLLQHYAQSYGVDANRFRSSRRPFEQQLNTGGVVFEPGKCILCGICVKLTEMSGEPLGLTFIGRGFDMRVGAPFGRSVADGLSDLAEECVRHCPTGALVFADESTHKANGGG
jgi:ferredoxin